ncbi:MAG: F0F1 ATP synthase subunit B [FCB group bacterium]|nr:F0F1 ATP synthase subunit B [FCB group bacterium]
MLEVHGGLLAWTVITFLLLLVILGKIAWKPIIEALENRERDIRDALSAAEQARAEADKVSQDYDEMIKKARSEVQQIVAEGKVTGEKVRASIEENARLKAAEMLENAKGQIEAEREKAIREIQAVVVDLSVKAATKVIEKNLDTDDNRRLIEKTLMEIGKA